MGHSGYDREQGTIGTTLGVVASPFSLTQGGLAASARVLIACQRASRASM
jgi:hypothetical protein